jgi:hypothetical protein
VDNYAIQLVFVLFPRLCFHQDKPYTIVRTFSTGTGIKVSIKNKRFDFLYSTKGEDTSDTAKNKLADDRILT